MICLSTMLMGSADNSRQRLTNVCHDWPKGLIQLVLTEKLNQPTPGISTEDKLSDNNSVNLTVYELTARHLLATCFDLVFDVLGAERSSSNPSRGI